MSCTHDHDNKPTGVWSMGIPSALRNADLSSRWSSEIAPFSPVQWASFGYDAFGRRGKATGVPSQGAVWYYLSSGQNKEVAYNSQGQRVRYFVHGPTNIDERVAIGLIPCLARLAANRQSSIMAIESPFGVRPCRSSAIRTNIRRCSK